MPHLLLSAIALCGLSLTVFCGSIRYICFSASDGLDFHLRIHHLQKDASICPPSWLGCITACLPVFIADAKSLQMLYHFLFPIPVIFQSIFLLSAHSGHSLKEAGLCYSQAHSYLVALLFFSSSPSVQIEYPWEIWLCLGYLFFCPADRFFFLLISLQFAKILPLIMMYYCQEI